MSEIVFVVGIGVAVSSPMRFGLILRHGKMAFCAGCGLDSSQEYNLVYVFVYCFLWGKKK